MGPEACAGSARARAGIRCEKMGGGGEEHVAAALRPRVRASGGATACQS